MAAVHSTMLPLGTTAPAFALPDTGGRTVTLDDFRDARALVVVFISNHCPYVRHLRAGLADVARRYQPRGVAFVAVNANDTERYPADSPEEMRREKAEVGYPFPYLFDETQEVAKAYRAACTPDFFLFDAERRLAYRGQFDGSRPRSDVPVTGQDLRAAMDALLEDRPVPAEQAPSIGCNIKWKPGNEPEWFG
ncbi:MAG TPA: thioredoxin family protein [Longimicrobiaceae bacterium]|nr:thioredoxin family protein [Longimicrobiaceae bacterium]